MAAWWFSESISLITWRITSGTEGALSSHLITLKERKTPRVRYDVSGNWKWEIELGL